MKTKQNNPYVDANGVDRSNEIEFAFENTKAAMTCDPDFYAELLNDFLFQYIHGTKETPMMQMVKKIYLESSK